MRIILSCVVLVLWVRVAPSSAFPDFVWTNSSHSYYDCEGTLEFCQDPSDPKVFGYRNAGETGGCGGFEYTPLIRVEAGKNYKLTLKNTAPTSSSNPHTNIHPHGLHIGGDGNEDDIRRVVHSGNCLDYNWTISADQDDGFYWYHPHPHEYTDPQFDGGAFGPLIVDKPGASHPESVKHMIANYEKVLILSDSVHGIQANFNSSETFALKPETWHLIRLLHADAAGKRESVAINGACEARHVAYDGVWRSTVPRPEIITEFELTASSRTDIAIKCSGAGVIKFGNTDIVELTTEGTDDDSKSSPYNRTNFTDPDSDQPWNPVRPDYLQDLRNITNPNPQDISMSAAKISGFDWDPVNPAWNVSYNQVQQFDITGSKNHPFHMHLWHMQIQTEDGCGSNFFEEGEYYDTISAQGSCLVRFKTVDIGGTTVMHCHVLGHEDNGAMVWMDVTGGPSTSNEHIEEYSC